MYIYTKNRQKILIILKLIYNNIIMEYQKIINLLDDTTNPPSKFRARNWVATNDKSQGTYSSVIKLNLKFQ